MANFSDASFARATICIPPFIEESNFGSVGGYVDGRLCRPMGSVRCCLPCPMTDWFYPDSFKTTSTVANWIATISGICCSLMLLSWVALPVEKTNRHYLSVCFVLGVLLMSLGFIVPLAAQPDQCFDAITPNDMRSSAVCGISGSFIILGGWVSVVWAFLRSLSLHLQICWQVVVGRKFMILSHIAGWGLPCLGLILALVLSGVSFRFGAICHVNHPNSLADLWIPLLFFAGTTVVMTFATFGYCLKVYLAAMSDGSASTEGSGLPGYSNSVATMTPRQAYHRVKRVIALQWRGILIVSVIIIDVIFFAIVLVFQDHIVQNATDNPEVAEEWIKCLVAHMGDKNKCLHTARAMVVNESTISAVLFLLALNGIIIFLTLGRWSMVTGWSDLFKNIANSRKKEFVSVDARYDSKRDSKAYEMLSKDSSVSMSPISLVSPARSPSVGREKSEYFAQTGYQYRPPTQSYSSPRPPQQAVFTPPHSPGHPRNYEGELNPLGMHRV
ncbi:hypothetical protein HIM_02348 [Hirsutella minnesotensis 3608]|nr:hypothetical protein HIM_02348 [Hirsutella minnesotensis 3608]